jgi:DNA-binding transcriptional LysR family regulator
MASGEFDLRQLQILLTVSLTGSYTAAAETLGYTQPAVSYQMRKLQNEVGTPLVVRAGRGLVLTEAGRSLAQHAKKIFASVRAARDEIGTPGGARKRARTCRGLPELLRDPASRHPDEAGQNRPVDPPEPGAGRTRPSQDSGTLRRDGPGSAVHLGQRIPARRRGIHAPDPADDGSALCGRTPRPPARLSIRDRPGRPGWRALGDEKARDRFVTACAAAGFAPKIAATADDHVTLQNLVAAGLGVTLMTELALAAHLDLRLVARPLRNWPLRNTYALLWPDMVQVPAVAAVLRAMRMCARDVAIGPHGDLSGPGC